MINKSEIDQKAIEFEIHSSNVERDYVFGWLLHGIFTISDLKNTVFLKGGNALRKGYFESTRFSKDLDLGIPGDIDQDKLLTEINKVCDYIQEKAQVTFIKDENNVKEKFIGSNAPLSDLKVYEIRIYFNDFYGEKSTMILRISLDLTRFDKVLLPIQTVKLIHPYSDAEQISCDIRCMKLEEIIATKLKCLLQRQHTPDLFDYAYSIKLLGGSLNKEEVVRTLIQKTIFSRNPHVLKDILKNISQSYFKEYWNKTIICAKQTMVTVDDALNLFLQDLDSLFGIYHDNGYRDFVFFGPNLRVPIMEAGRTQTLLKVRYKGYERLIEPYALKYLQKRDGTQREYLCCYNVSGGEEDPGPRKFIAENFESIENTDQKFGIRKDWIIELSKAGELPEDRYLFDPNRPVIRPTKRFRSYGSSYGIKYSYRCPVCGKKFTKISMSPNLGKHKSKSGYPCYATYGIYEGTKY